MGAAVVATILLVNVTFPTVTRVNRVHRGFTVKVGNNIGLGGISFRQGVGRDVPVKVANKLATHCVSRGCFTVVYNTRIRLGFSRQN